MAETKDVMIELKNIVVRFGDFEALHNINVDVRKGEFFTFLGPSGCGKTTTLRTITGFIEPVDGSVNVNGEDITHVPIEKRNIGIVFQSYALFPTMTVYDNIAFGLKIQKLGKAEVDRKVREIARKVDLSDEQLKKAVSQLSGGQQQRVAIARALVNEPQVLLLDEPLGALDLKLRQEMQVELKRMQQRLGITFIYVTHDQEEALTMSDTIVVLKDGEIQQIGTPTDIYNEPKNPFVADFIGESNIIPGIMLQDYRVRINNLTYDCVDAGFKKNVEVDVVIRPEDIDIIPPEKARIQGVVQSVVFMGVHYEVDVDCGGYEWIVHTTDYVAVGETVGIDIPPDAIHVMKKTRSMNIFDGIAYPDDRLVTIDETDFPAEIPASFNEKDELLVEIAPKDVQLLAPQDEGTQVTGFVKACMFLGTHYEVTVDCGENDWIAFSDEFMEDGEQVGIRVPADCIRLSAQSAG